MKGFACAPGTDGQSGPVPARTRPTDRTADTDGPGSRAHLDDNSPGFAGRSEAGKSPPPQARRVANLFYKALSPCHGVGGRTLADIVSRFRAGTSILSRNFEGGRHAVRQGAVLVISKRDDALPCCRWAGSEARVFDRLSASLWLCPNSHREADLRTRADTSSARSGFANSGFFPRRQRRAPASPHSISDIVPTCPHPGSYGWLRFRSGYKRASS